MRKRIDRSREAREEAKRLILQHIGIHDMKAEDLLRRTGLPRMRFYRALRELKEEKEVEQGGQRGYWHRNREKWLREKYDEVLAPVYRDIYNDVYESILRQIGFPREEITNFKKAWELEKKAVLMLKEAKRLLRASGKDVLKELKH